MLDWLIIGGGPHGRFIADAIRRAAPAAELAVLDPASLLDAWSRRADACGMTYLRSSNAHHLGARANSLRVFAASHGFDGRDQLGYYRRPSRALFEAHAHWALTSSAETIPAAAQAIDRSDPGWRVHTDRGDVLTARRVVLATGPDQPYRPPGLAGAEHVFDRDFGLGPPGPRTAIIGGGITGAQLALRAAEAGHTIRWLTRTPPRSADFDSDPCYAGPRCMKPFLDTPIEQRSALLAQARQPGTLPPDVLTRITAALGAGQLAWQRAHVADYQNDQLTLEGDRTLGAERVILATGFEPVPSHNSLLGRCIEPLGLTTDGNGHVVINDALEAASGLHLAGRPASLQLGPMAGNLKGARLAGTALAAVARREAIARHARPRTTHVSSY